MFKIKIRFVSLPGLLSYTKQYWHIYTKETRLPPLFVLGIVLICIAPFILNHLGIDFGTRTIVTNWSQISEVPASQLSDTLHFSLRGSFTHTILEWSAFCTAIFTAILAFVYFRIEGDVTTPVIGVALLCAGIMDAFHTLAADRLIDAVADNQNLIPFTWALCRLLNALLTVMGVSIFLILKPQKWYKNSFFIVSISIFFVVIAYSIIRICAVSYTLPTTMF
ncbi:MAG: hypothetical protein SAJ12_23275, partial [Jaaginema sp. PMC 1079.18]|nr:hypothetical protein [Jaaginema sp. PMC 1079.18]